MYIEQVVPEFITKIIQIFDCKVARHGNMIVGKTGAGKSVAWQTLQRAMGRLRKDNHESELFQKVIPTTCKVSFYSAAEYCTSHDCDILGLAHTTYIPCSAHTHYSVSQ